MKINCACESSSIGETSRDSSAAFATGSSRIGRLFSISDKACRLRGDVRGLAEPIRSLNFKDAPAPDETDLTDFRLSRLCSRRRLIACHIPGKSIASNYKNVNQFNFDVAVGPKNYHIEGYLTRSAENGRRPGLLVLNGGEGNVDSA